MSLSEWISVVFVTVGAFFFFAGTVGLLRFPDVYSRLHALTKADNTGLGFITVAMMIQMESWTAMLKLLLIWLLIMFAGATVCHLIARAALYSRIPLWRQK
jgi:multicomponent Na+:H+ antiporter subunit G